MQSGIAAQDSVSSGKLNANERTSLIQVVRNAPIWIAEGKVVSEGLKRLIALLLQFCHEVWLFQRGAASKKFDEGIFQLIP